MDVDQNAPAQAGDSITDGIFTMLLSKNGAIVYNALKKAGRPAFKFVARADAPALQAGTAQGGGDAEAYYKEGSAARKRERLLARMAKRADRMERDAKALSKEMAQVDEFWYTGENIVRDIERVNRDIFRIATGEPI